jgi:ribosome-associated protein
MKIQETQFTLEGREYIELKNLMKLASLVNSGGEVKMYCQNGEVRVNGEVETRRGKKLRIGDKLLFGIKQVEIIE